MASDREIRTIRIEDWEGNVYRPEGVGSGGGGGQTIGGDDIGEAGSGSVNTTDGVLSGDPTANAGTSIIIPSSTTANRNVATVVFDDVKFGKWAITTRIKSTVTGTTTNILQINTYYVDNTGANATKKLSTTYVKANNFTSNTAYSEIGFVTEFTGVYTTSVSLKVEILLLKGTGATITFDSITTAKAFVAITGTSTQVL